MAMKNRYSNLPMACRDMFERTVCDCDLCRVGCRSMPGCLAPSDIENIGKRRPDALADENWLASAGAKVGVTPPDGDRLVVLQIPTIVPATKSDGSCVFLDAEGGCSIHDVAPYGCGYVDVHMNWTDGNRRMSACFMEILEDGRVLGPYSEMRSRLLLGCRIAEPTEERREKYRSLMEAEEFRLGVVNQTTKN